MMLKLAAKICSNVERLGTSQGINRTFLDYFFLCESVLTEDALFQWTVLLLLFYIREEQ